MDSLSSVTSGYDGKSIDSKLTNNTAPVVVVGGGGRLLAFVCVVTALLSVRRVIKLEPAVVFKA